MIKNAVSLVDVVDLPIRLRPALNEDQFRRLAAKAAAQNDTFESFVLKVLEREADGSPPETISVKGSLTASMTETA